VALGLIPFGYQFWGISGAVFSLIVGEVAVWGSSFLFSCQLLHLQRPHYELARPALSAAVLLILLWLLPLELPVIGRLALVVVGLGLALYACEDRFRAAIANKFGG
jgi:hypothetical protein